MAILLMDIVTPLTAEMIELTIPISTRSFSAPMVVDRMGFILLVVIILGIILKKLGGMMVQAVTITTDFLEKVLTSEGSNPLLSFFTKIRR
jgi:hypothetical protein